MPLFHGGCYRIAAKIQAKPVVWQTSSKKALSNWLWSKPTLVSERCKSCNWYITGYFEIVSTLSDWVIDTVFCLLCSNVSFGWDRRGEDKRKTEWKSYSESWIEWYDSRREGDWPCFPSGDSYIYNNRRKQHLPPECVTAFAKMWL
jgi:hypothetical protein